MFESWDQRNDLIYYVVTLSTGESFMASVASEDNIDDAELCRRVASVAASGKTNTSYTGSVM